MNTPRPFTNPPMPGVAEKLIYKNDLKSAVDRLDTCWNKTQLEDILNSVKFFVQKMEK
jgi:hypothetical protein